MNKAFTQTDRMGKLTTALGKDVLLLLRFNGSDHVNDLFEYQIDALANNTHIDFDQIVGTHATVELASEIYGSKFYDGIVTEIKWAGNDENGSRYSLSLRPWLWLAGKRRYQKIFHRKTVVQIIEEVLVDYAGLCTPHLENRLTHDYPELEYTVQYRESDMAFVQRLMERFGISYHFSHKLGSHTMILTDGIDHHDPVSGEERLYRPFDGHHNAEFEHFWAWLPERRLTTGAMRLTDYNFKTPVAAMQTERVGDAVYDQGQIESYDYPGDYLEQGQGKGVVALRTLQERGQDRRHRAEGDCLSMCSGKTVTLTGDHAAEWLGQSYLCLSATHSYTSNTFGTVAETKSDEYAYSGQYVFMPVTAPFAPERKTNVPCVQGPQTAVVVGEGEIDCDEYGRILVHFHWDLEKRFSMRCRVSQNWASKGWGGMVIPRIGMEVVVEFLEGDPDKPLVTGCVYNGKNHVPYDLPANKTKSVFRTDTHKGKGFNELTFEDERGREEIYMHGQKDQTIHIENNRAKRVDVNQTESVGHNKAIEIGNNHEEAIGGNMHVVVGANRLSGFVSKVHSHFGNALMDKASKILSSANLMGGLGAGGFGKGNMTVHIGGNKAETTAVTSTETVGVNKATIVGGTRQDFTGGSYHSFSGQHRMDETLRTISQVAGERWQAGSGKTSIVLDAASGKITITADDIEMKGRKSIKMTAPRIDLN